MNSPVDAGLPAYRVRRSRRARRLQVRVSPWRGVEVVVPVRCAEGRVTAFVRAHSSWIQEALRQLEGERGAAERLPHSITLRALRENWHVRYSALGPAGRVQLRYREDPGAIVVAGGSQDPGRARQLLRDWTRQRARATLVPWLTQLATETGLDYREVSIRGQKTRWGSCSSDGSISLNYKLLFLKPSLVRYLLIHELSHIRYLNHSRKFWALVGRFEPACEARDRELGTAWREIPGWVEME